MRLDELGETCRVCSLQLKEGHGRKTGRECRLLMLEEERKEGRSEGTNGVDDLAIFESQEGGHRRDFVFRSDSLLGIYVDSKELCLRVRAGERSVLGSDGLREGSNRSRSVEMALMFRFSVLVTMLTLQGPHHVA